MLIYGVLENWKQLIVVYQLLHQNQKPHRKNISYWSRLPSSLQTVHCTPAACAAPSCNFDTHCCHGENMELTLHCNASCM